MDSMDKEIKTWTLWRDERINEEESKLLRKAAAELPIPLDERAKRDVEVLVDAFLRRNDAVGLAAPQIGISRRVIVFKNRNFNDRTPLKKDSGEYDVLINPRITQCRGEEEQENEACLSCPEISADVTRWTEIKVRAFDREGRKISKRYKGFLARVVQHELDHLDGKLIIDRGESLYYPSEKKAFFDGIFGEKVLYDE
ncbi:MAG: peptide deformylase [Syntrophales bacterium]|nr:peptide deformylase [Syntrophales bacterium]